MEKKYSALTLIMALSLGFTLGGITCGNGPVDIWVVVVVALFAVGFILRFLHENRSPVQAEAAESENAGTFTLTAGGKTTAPIPYNADMETIKEEGAKVGINIYDHL